MATTFSQRDPESSAHPRDLPRWNNVVLLSYSLVDEVHSLVDEPVPSRSHLTTRKAVRRAAVLGLIFFGTLISTLGKLGEQDCGSHRRHQLELR